MSIFPTIHSASYTKEYFFQEDICRLCWSKDATQELYSKLISCTLKRPIYYKVTDYLGINLSEDSEIYPRKLCENCLLNLEQFHNFRNFCQDSDEKLHKILSGNKSNAKLSSQPPILEKVKDFNSIDLVTVESSDSLLHIELDTYSEQEVDRDSTNTGSISVQNNLEKSEHAHNVNKVPTIPKTKDSSQIKTSLNPNGKIIIETAQKQKIKPNGMHGCTYCSMLFDEKEKLTQHKSFEHGVGRDGKYSCFGCKKQFDKRLARFNHETFHCKLLKEGFKCADCNMLLQTRGLYEIHRSEHRQNKIIKKPNLRSFKCCKSKCEKWFASKRDRKQHVKKEHFDYVCETCGKAFTMKAYLDVHITTHTGEKKFGCPLCSYRCSQKQNIDVHLRIHTGERPYACDLCPQRCVSSSNLQRHRRRHLFYEKKYQCEPCDKRYETKYLLQEHIAIVHEQTRSLPCPHCNAVYLRRNALNRHLQQKHGLKRRKGAIRHKLQKIQLNSQDMEQDLNIPQSQDMEQDSDITSVTHNFEKQDPNIPNVNLDMEQGLNITNVSQETRS